MHAFTDNETRLFEPTTSAPRWHGKGRRIRFYLRKFGRGGATRVSGLVNRLITALHESRSQSAARVICRHRHLIDGDRRANSAGRWTQPSGTGEP